MSGRWSFGVGVMAWAAVAAFMPAKAQDSIWAAVSPHYSGVWGKSFGQPTKEAAIAAALANCRHVVKSDPDSCAAPGWTDQPKDWFVIVQCEKPRPATLAAVALTIAEAEKAARQALGDAGYSDCRRVVAIAASNGREETASTSGY